MLQRFVILFILVAICIECRAQKNIPASDTTKYWRVQTNDNNQFVGEILSVEDGIMTLRTVSFGTIKIHQTDIHIIEEIDIKTVVGNKNPPDNLHFTHYFIAPNGFGLKPGEAYYHNAMLLVNQFSIGVTKHLSMTAGTVPIYLLGSNVAPFWVMPKVSLPLGNRVHFGAAVLYGKSFFLGDRRYTSGDNRGVALGLGVLTIGSREKNISFGMGQRISGGLGRQPIVTLASMTRIGSHSFLMTESYFATAGASNQASGIISIGGRRVFRRIGLDFGGFVPVEKNMRLFLAIPWVGLSVPLGRPHLND